MLAYASVCAATLLRLLLFRDGLVTRCGNAQEIGTALVDMIAHCVYSNSMA